MQHIKSRRHAEEAGQLALFVKHLFFAHSADHELGAGAFGKDAGLGVADAGGAAGLVETAGNQQGVGGQTQLCRDLGQHCAQRRAGGYGFGQLFAAQAELFDHLGPKILAVYVPHVGGAPVGTLALKHAAHAVEHIVVEQQHFFGFGKLLRVMLAEPQHLGCGVQRGYRPLAGNAQHLVGREPLVYLLGLLLRTGVHPDYKVVQRVHLLVEKNQGFALDGKTYSRHVGRGDGGFFHYFGDAGLKTIPIDFGLLLDSQRCGGQQMVLFNVGRHIMSLVVE